MSEIAKLVGAICVLMVMVVAFAATIGVSFGVVSGAAVLAFNFITGACLPTAP